MINPWLLERVDMRYATGLCYPQLHRAYRVVTVGETKRCIFMREQHGGYGKKPKLPSH